MNSGRFDDVSVIVRECGERTAEACIGQLVEIFHRPPTRISARPFHATLRQSLESGLDQGRSWTLCIDADVLVLPGLAAFLEQARQMPPEVFEAQGLVIDKLLPVRRPAGNHLYRTCLIERAIPLIPTTGTLRPESDMILAMASQGHTAWQSSTVVGLHDFEQAYDDIYRKALLHGRKHDYLIAIYRPIWEALGELDDDYRIARLALEHASSHHGTPEISRDFGEIAAAEAQLALGLSAKGALGTFRQSDVQSILARRKSLLAGIPELLEQLQVSMYSDIDPAGEDTSASSDTSRLHTIRCYLQQLVTAVRGSKIGGAGKQGK